MIGAPDSSLEIELLKRFGYAAFRPGQKALVEAVLSRRDALGVMPTGGGKSLCFQLPATLLPGTAVVISPLIALMKDQVDALRARGIHAEGIHSGLTAEERRRARVALQSGTLRLLYMAPERMQQEGFMELLGRMPISFLAIDEAHCISQWGHDFRPDYRRLGNLRKQLQGSDPLRRLGVIALTATATRRVQEDIVERLGMRDTLRVITGFRRQNLSFQVRQVAGRAEKLRLLRELLLQAIAENGSAIVYAATRKNVELIAEKLDHPADRELRAAGTAYYHAGLSDEERVRVQEAFLSGRKRVLVATNAFGMGIDKPDVRLVVHYDVPGSIEAYYQEAGRAGRDGKPARCVLLFNYADVATQEFLIQKTAEQEGAPEAALPEGSDAQFGAEGASSRETRIHSQKALLRQLVRYAYASACRQQLILGYFGDSEARDFRGCGSCDFCRPERRELVEVDDATAQACRAILATVARLDQRFGKTRIRDLVSSQLSPEQAPRVRLWIDQLAEAGYLQVSGLEYPVLGMTRQGREALQGALPLMLPPAAAAPTPRLQRQRSLASASAAHKPVQKPTSVDDADPALLDQLRRFRSAEARARQVPAYVIFHDSTLVALAARRPLALDELAAVPGLGPKKLEQYGNQLLQILKGGPLTAGS